MSAMGSPKRKKFERPKRPWDKKRIEMESELIKEYGLRRKREIWRAESILRNFRRRARELSARRDEAKEKELLEKLNKLGLIKKNSNLDDVLGLSVKDILNRRLQTLLVKRGLANTMKQSRQYIVHGHIEIDGRKMKWPSCLVPLDKEDKIRSLIKNK